MLKVMGSLSRLFSETDVPYLDSRVAENLFCRSFNADNRGREDIAIDAVLNGTGIGIKTFMGDSAQKIAEFNKKLATYSSLSTIAKAKQIAELRNERIDFAKRTCGLNDMLYHCVFREKGKMGLIETEMKMINLSKIKLVGENHSKSIHFSDGKDRYYFNLSKSVLLKSFPKTNVLATIDVDILDDPFELLVSTMGERETTRLLEKEEENPTVLLPLYSIKDNEKVVPGKSGLNQWNASGRPGDPDEVYIPIPAWIHRVYPNFFPGRETPFKLVLPDGSILDAKVCQDNNKALMSKQNKDLGKWILRKVLKLPEKKLLTYRALERIGIDSVSIEKLEDKKYKINFKKIGSFEEFTNISLQKEEAD
jgi:hypothetical protein